MTTVEELKREFTEKWKDGYIFERGGYELENEEEEFIDDLNTLIEAVIEERIPTDEEVRKASAYAETTIDGCKHESTSWGFEIGCNWFRNKMRKK